MRRRGFSLLAVVVVLAILAILLQAAVALLTARLRETRWRGESRYAEELARSGVDFARACLDADEGGGSCGRTLPVEGGEIVVEVTPTAKGQRITSRGRVLAGSEVRAERTEVVEVRAAGQPEEDPGGEAPPDPGAGDQDAEAEAEEDAEAVIEPF